MASDDVPAPPRLNTSAARNRSSTPGGATPASLRAEADRKEVSVLWERLRQATRQSDELQKKCDDGEKDKQWLQKELEQLSARLRVQSSRAEKAEARCHQLQKELSAAIGLSLSPAPSRDRGSSRRAFTPPHVRSLPRIPQFGSPHIEEPPEEHTLWTARGFVSASSASTSVGTTQGLRSEFISARAGGQSQTISEICASQKRSPAENAATETEEEENNANHDEADAALTIEAAASKALCERPHPSQGSAATTKDAVPNMESDKLEAQILREQLSSRETELQTLQEAHDKQKKQLCRSRREALTLRTKAEIARCRLKVGRRKAASRCAQMEAEWQELNAWRDELFAWYEQKHGAGKSKGVQEAAEGNAQRSANYGLPTPSRNSPHASIKEIAEGTDDFEPELDPALLPNCSKDSRRIARGKSSPWRFASFLKNWRARAALGGTDFHLGL